MRARTCLLRGKCKLYANSLLHFRWKRQSLLRRTGIWWPSTSSAIWRSVRGTGEARKTNCQCATPGRDNSVDLTQSTPTWRTKRRTSFTNFTVQNRPSTTKQSNSRTGTVFLGRSLKVLRPWVRRYMKRKEFALHWRSSICHKNSRTLMKTSWSAFSDMTLVFGKNACFRYKLKTDTDHECL